MKRKTLQSTSGEQCPSCGSPDVITTWEQELLKYGEQDIPLQVPVLSCNNCDFQFTDDRASELRQEAICEQLRVMTPTEIRATREAYGLSIAAFSQTTGIGTASISRWENGQQIQSTAYDQYLFLLGFQDNILRLKQRHSRMRATSRHELPRFRAIVPDESLLDAADSFQLVRLKVG